MVLIGLTGGIGMGKSTVAEYLLGCGEHLVDTDALARRFVEPGQPALNEIRSAFGQEVFDSGGTLDRKALARVAFSSAEARKKLEEILHPRIRAAWKEEVEQWRRAGVSRGVVIIPLLFETGAQTEMDKVICVGCSGEVQNRRLLARGWTPAEIKARNAAQWPVEKKMDHADGVIWNESTMELCAEQCARLFSAL
jgi:dephospho-CoA kinase